MKNTSGIPAFRALALGSALLLLQACSPEQSANGIESASSRIWHDWRVDCYKDSTFFTGRELYVFKRATASEIATLPSSDWGEPAATSSGAGTNLLWINDSSFKCNAKGFYATQGSDGSLAPATTSFAYEKDGGGHPEERRSWRGIEVDCYADTALASRGKGFYQFKELAKGEAQKLSSSGLSEPTPAGKIDGRPLFWVRDSSWSCRGVGFYVARTAEGGYEPVGVGYSYSVGKGRHGAAAIVETGSSAPHPAPRGL